MDVSTEKRKREKPCPGQRAWFLLRMGALAITALVFWGLAVDFRFDSLGGLSVRELFWLVLMPAVVMTIYFAPMLWRNVCPLATTNLWYFNLSGRKLLERFGLAANRREGLVGKAYEFLKKKGMAVSAFLFWTIVPTRLLFFNMSAEATFWLLVSVFAAAAIMGLLFPVKSGWCSSICPVSAAEKAYGLNPAFFFPNTRCGFYSREQGRVLGCSGCSFNCTDVVDPEHAYWQATSQRVFHDTLNAEMRKVFLATLPAFLLSFYFFASGVVTLPEVGLSVKIPFLYSFFAVMMLLSYALYATVKGILRRRVERQVGLLSLERPNALYSLYKRRLDMCFMTVAMNIVWWFSAYAIVNTVVAKAFPLSPEAGSILFVSLSLSFLGVSLYSLGDGWKESFLPGRHRSSWW
jgi:nitrite reductase (NADH) large subunit